MGILESMTKYLNLEERLSISRALQGTLSSRTDKESTGTPVICQKKDIMQGHVLQTAAGVEKTDTCCAMGQEQEGVLQVLQKIFSQLTQ